MTEPDDAPGRVALRLSGVTKHAGARAILAGADAAFRSAALTRIRAGRGAGKTTLARLLTGQTFPEQGRIERLGPAAPLVGSGWGFAAAAPTRSGLELRAASYGLDLASYCDAVAAFLEDPDGLRRPFNRFGGRDRAALLYASAYLIPSSVYVADGALLPPDPATKTRLIPLLEATRRRAAVIWVVDETVNLSHYGPDARLQLIRGALVEDDGAPPAPPAP